MTSTLNSDCQFTLMMCAGAGNAAGKNLRAFGNEATKLCYVFIIDDINFIDAEAADFSAALASTRTAFPDRAGQIYRFYSQP